MTISCNNHIISIKYKNIINNMCKISSDHLSWLTMRINTNVNTRMRAISSLMRVFLRWQNCCSNNFFRRRTIGIKNFSPLSMRNSLRRKLSNSTRILKNFYRWMRSWYFDDAVWAGRCDRPPRRSGAPVGGVVPSGAVLGALGVEVFCAGKFNLWNSFSLCIKKVDF